MWPYRVIFNGSQTHPQWIVVWDKGDGRPEMLPGVERFTNEGDALALCEALRRRRGSPLLPFPLSVLCCGGFVWHPA